MNIEKITNPQEMGPSEALDHDRILDQQDITLRERYQEKPRYGTRKPNDFEQDRVPRYQEPHLGEN